ncbi:3-mercaptopyruvate sulfurtransferase [Sphingomonas sp. Leaf412]|uniref:sulfurtransferase n=1 Tax=Sphingomonas sp. Leaf412 TaxID=1736370 RepID=UPI0006F9E4BD|nr:sulfurtransferase [Sphingomonas sp. Leaf412]KQT32926.1 3-mercaptopyruvate sulfurtransferase [Sphingomonas sp. Leaf412]
MPPLVSTRWLATEAGARDLRIADATLHANFAGEPPRDARAEFAAGHIPGAVFMDLAAFADPAAPLPSTLPSPAQFGSRMAKLGLGDGTRIVLYDDAAHRTAARAWVMLRSFGFTGVAILDGGLAAWRAAGQPLATGEETPSPRHATPRDAGVLIRDKAAMLAAQANGTEQIVDARSSARFTGAEADPRPDVAPGHIPGSRNLPYTRLFNDDGTWKRGDDLAAAFAEAGVDLDRPMAMTCGSGITASVLAFGAHLLGREAALYDGSWTEWGSDPATPKAVGPA